MTPDLTADVLALLVTSFGIGIVIGLTGMGGGALMTPALIFLGVPGDDGGEVELTHNWGEADYSGGRNFGHLAYQVDDIYETCRRLMDAGITINRPPRDGRMAFVRSPDNISIELLQKGESLPPAEPWASMPNTGAW